MYALTHTPTRATHTSARLRSLARERVRDGYGDISSHVQSHNVTRNTRAHQSFSRKWNLLPSSRRISAPCTQYFARPRARPLCATLAVYGETALVCARMTRRILRTRGTRGRNFENARMDRRDRAKTGAKREYMYSGSVNGHRDFAIANINLRIDRPREGKRVINLGTRVWVTQSP